MENKIIKGDCIQCMQSMQDNSIDAIVTDPPYGLEFMGKDWDKFKEGKNIAGGTSGIDTPFGRSKPLNSVYQYTNQQKLKMQHFFQEFATEALRVLKPGGFLLAFGGSRTYHRLACGIEDAGFEIRDQIMWLYGSGFPKSLNIGKQIDKLQGNEREDLGISKEGVGKINDGRILRINALSENEKGMQKEYNLTKGTSEWEGWGTALKPAHEPIVVARKPLAEKNVALNVLKYGTGGINIDACRIGFKNGENSFRPTGENPLNPKDGWNNNNLKNVIGGSDVGRFPANIILDEEAGKMLDEQSGVSISSPRPNSDGKIYTTNTYGSGRCNMGNAPKDKGGASRFFYCAKASKSERNFGMEEKQTTKKYEVGEPVRWNKGGVWTNDTTPAKNNHPTVKPIKLMEYLIKLVSKEGAVVLDPFLGSGTTGIACVKLNRNFIGIEKEAEYIKIAEARIKPFLQQRKL